MREKQWVGVCVAKYHEEGRYRISLCDLLDLAYQAQEVADVGALTDEDVSCHGHQEQEPIRPPYPLAPHHGVLFGASGVASRSG